MKPTTTLKFFMSLAFLALTPPAQAFEGMWTMNHLPLKKLQSDYGFTPTKAWITLVTQASARLAEGCSASFVSADGLVMTNHHCVAECLSQISPTGQDDFTAGYATTADVKPTRCPDMELDRLDKISNVTPQMDAALKSQHGAAYIAAEHAEQSTLKSACTAGDPKKWRCDIVSFYQGARFGLYRYRRYQDIRLVFAPEDDAADFGGDPDNFNFPRYDLDVAFLRAYAHGKPVHTPYFKFAPNGPKAGEMVATSGNPGRTEREDTVAELKLFRNLELPQIYGYYSTLDGVLWQYSRQSPHQAQTAKDYYYFGQNDLKVFTGFQQALASPALFAAKQKQQDALKSWIDANPARRKKFGNPWAELKPALAAERRLFARYSMIEQGMGFQGRLFHYAKTLVRAAEQRAKPDAQRLPYFQNANLPAIRAQLASPAPIHPAFERTLLAFSLTKFRQTLGADNKTVHQVLAHNSPTTLADSAVNGTKLADPNYRMKLWNGGASAIAKSTDPMIILAREIEPEADALRTKWDNQVQAPKQAATRALSRARFAKDGTATYPDATFTQRVSFGRVKGWTEHGKPVPPFTHFAGLYHRANGYHPFKLSKLWLTAKPNLNLQTPYDFVSTNDITGGNSGSPLIDKKGQIVGIAFDGNIHSIGGTFAYDKSNNRAVSADTAAIIEALRVVYHKKALVSELINGQK